MSADNVAVARQVLEALGRFGADEVIPLADPDVEWHSLFAFGGVYRGHAGTRQFMRDLDEAWDVGRAEVDDCLGVGDTALLVGRIHYRGKGSGVESETPVLWILRFRAGKVVSFRAFRDPEAVFAAIEPVD